MLAPQPWQVPAELRVHVTTLLSDLPAPKRIVALNEIAGWMKVHMPEAVAADVVLPVYDTVAHCELLDELTRHARALAAGEFRDRNGVACRTIMGTRGIGKVCDVNTARLRQPPSRFGAALASARGHLVAHC